MLLAPFSRACFTVGMAATILKRKEIHSYSFVSLKKKKKSNCIVTFHFGKEENKNIKNFIRQLKLFN